MKENRIKQKVRKQGRIDQINMIDNYIYIYTIYIYIYSYIQFAALHTTIKTSFLSNFLFNTVFTLVRSLSSWNLFY